MLDVLLDSALDLAKTLPVLALVYALLYWVEHRMRTTPALLSGPGAAVWFFGGGFRAVFG